MNASGNVEQVPCMNLPARSMWKEGGPVGYPPTHRPLLSNVNWDLKLESYNTAAGFTYGGLVAKVIIVGFYETQTCKFHLSKVHM